MSKYEELLKQRAELDKQIEAEYGTARIDAIAQIHTLMERFAISPQELGFSHRIKPGDVPTLAHRLNPLDTAIKDVLSHGAKPAAPKGTLPPKYRDPKTGTTWSGRGHTPHWIKGDKADYLIDKPQPELKLPPMHSRIGVSAIDQIKQSPTYVEQPRTEEHHHEEHPDDDIGNSLKPVVNALKEKFTSVHVKK